MCLETTIRMINHHTLPVKRMTTSPIDVAALDRAVRQSASEVERLQTAVQLAMQHSPPKDADELDAILVQLCAEHFPKAKPQRAPANSAIRTLHAFRDKARYTPVQREYGCRLLEAWHAQALLTKAIRTAKRERHQQNRENVLTLLADAEAAAQNGDQRQVYKLVRQLAPWKPRNRVRLATRSSVPRHSAPARVGAATRIFRISDALARVHSWMRTFHRTLDRGTTSIFATATGRGRRTGVGGAILSLDLKQAFDRSALADSLRLGRRKISLPQ